MIEFKISHNISIMPARMKLFKEGEKYYKSPEYTDINDPVLFLLKFIKKEYLLPTLSGNLFFSSLKYFRELEEKNGDKKFGDSMEGRVSVKLAKEKTKVYQILIDENNKIRLGQVFDPIQDINTFYGYDNKTAESVGIVSFMAVRRSDLSLNQTIISQPFYKLKSDAFQNIQNFNDKEDRIPIVIPMLRSVLIDVKNNTDRNDIVTYYDSISVKDYRKFNEDNYAIAFYKRKEYSNQKEYRFVKYMPNMRKVKDKETGKTKRLMGKSIYFPVLSHYIFVPEKSLDRYIVSWDS